MNLFSTLSRSYPPVDLLTPILYPPKYYSYGIMDLHLAQFEMVTHTPYDPSLYIVGHCGANIIDEKNAMLNMYITKKAFRGRGIGRQVYDRCIRSLRHMNVSINANWDHAAMYASAGFGVSSFKLMVYHCSMKHVTVEPERHLQAGHMVTLVDVALDWILEYDQTLLAPVTSQRRELLTRCMKCSLHGLVVLGEEGQVLGWGSVSKGDLAYSLMPLYADTPAIAEALINHLLARVPQDGVVEVSYPQTNLEAGRIFEGIGVTKGDTDHNMRMYNKNDVTLPLDRVYSLSNYHLTLC